VASMLKRKDTYLKIAEKTGASTATISRVNRSLNYGNDGYDMVFARMKSYNYTEIDDKHDKTRSRREKPAQK
ncbi:MAG: YerC/YecD family TrpR-related protein, partial [Lachnospiraceae bacterium]|nr:YerC/YecD family TrpR-related protein [Lachnospiraceae bacterium]